MVPDGWTAEEVEETRGWARLWLAPYEDEGAPSDGGNITRAARFVLAVLDAPGALADSGWVCKSCAQSHPYDHPCPAPPEVHTARDGTRWVENGVFTMPVHGEHEAWLNPDGTGQRVMSWDFGSWPRGDIDEGRRRILVPAPDEAPVGCRLCGAADASVPHADRPSIPVPDGWEPVGWRVPKRGEMYLTSDGRALEATGVPSSTPRLVLRRVEPEPVPAREALARALVRSGTPWPKVHPDVKESFRKEADRLIRDHADVLRAAADAAEEGNPT